MILGTSKTGKSTIISRLSTANGEALNGDDDLTSGNDVLDLGLSYSCLDVGDESEEGMELSPPPYYYCSEWNTDFVVFFSINKKMH